MSTANLSNGSLATTQSIPLQPLDGQAPDAQPASSPVQSQDGGTPPVGLEYGQELVHRMKKIESNFRTIIVLWDYADLQHLNLDHIRHTLNTIQGDMDESKTTTEAQLKLLRETMHHYATAIRDYKSLLEFRKDPFGGSESLMPYQARPLVLDAAGGRPDRQATDAVREFLRKRLPQRLSYSHEEFISNPYNDIRERTPETYSPFVDRLARFLIAVGGGAALIVPMLIMSFHPSQTKSLVTVSVAVVLFALTLSLAFSTDNKDTLQATATYAAVLVVFVGTSGTSGTSG